MKVEKIAPLEATFESTGIDSKGKKHVLTPESISFNEGNEKMDYVRLKLASGDKSFYFEDKFPKDQIVLHFTCGYLPGDVATLTTPDNHVSVPFIIGRNGRIYNLFPSGGWSYHLGKNALGGNEKRSKSTIGIEISNIGPLILKNNDLVTSYRDVHGNLSDTYCAVSELSLYTHQLYRNFEYYATFTPEQYKSLIVLLRYLTNRYQIPREFLPITGRFEATQSVVGFRGIVSHVNYRAADKVDIGPCFEWDKVITGVKA